MLPKNAILIQELLQKNNIDTRIIEFAASTKTATDAAAAIGCQVAQIAKSIVFKTEQTHKPVLILVSGPNRVNEQELEKHIGEKVIKADADFIKTTTGFTIGGVPPLGHKHEIKLIFIDSTLLQFETLWAAAGTPHTVFSIPSTKLIEITKGTVITL